MSVVKGSGVTTTSLARTLRDITTGPEGALVPGRRGRPYLVRRAPCDPPKIMLNPKTNPKSYQLPLLCTS